jgi:hypothetical protein
MPVSLFLIEIITPGITAPLASVTVPESVAPDTCAFAVVANAPARTKQTAREVETKLKQTLRAIDASIVRKETVAAIQSQLHELQTSRNQVFRQFALILWGVYRTRI